MAAILARLIRTWQGSFLGRCQQAVVDLLFPPQCAVCGTDLLSEPGEPLVCADCRRCLTEISEPVCRRCGMPTTAKFAEADACPRCRAERLYFDAVVEIGFYRDALRDAIIEMKQPHRDTLIHAVGGLLARRLDGQMPDWRVDLIAPVPIYWSRRLFRGVNVAELLARAIHRRTGLPLYENLLKCRRKTKKQGTLRPDERRRNVRGALAVSAGYDLTDARILLVDDVMTTGATANEAAKVCRKAGAAAVFVGVVARGVGV